MNNEATIPVSFVAQYSQRVIAMWNNRNYKWEDIKVGDRVLTMRNGFGSLGPVVRKVERVGHDTHQDNPNCLVLVDPNNTKQKSIVYKHVPTMRGRDEKHFWELITPWTEEDENLSYIQKKQRQFELTGWK